MTGLQPVCAVKRAHQRIAVVLADAVVGEFTLVEDFVQFRMIPDHDRRKARQIERTDPLVGMRPTRRVGKTRAVEPKLAGTLGHHCGEILFGSAQCLGDHDAGVIPGLDNDTAQKIVDTRPAVQVQEHRRRTRRRTAAPPGLFRYRQFIVQRQPPFINGFERHQDGHQLAH